MKTEKRSVINCSRCGWDHSEIEGRKLIRPSGKWTCWGICPTTNEPMCLCEIDEEEKPVKYWLIATENETLYLRRCYFDLLDVRIEFSQEKDFSFRCHDKPHAQVILSRLVSMFGVEPYRFKLIPVQEEEK